MSHPPSAPRWSADNLAPQAVAVSASRRTDIPALYASWFARRLDEGFADYIPAGPPRRVRASLRPEHVTHFNFWTKWPRPFFRALETVLARGFPVLFNVTITGLGGTDLEPHVPDADRVARATRELATRIPAAAIQWRYDPLLLTRRFHAAHHRERFRRLAEALAGHVDRVTTSFVEPYGRRVKPDLRAWERESGDALVSGAEVLELAADLLGIARQCGIPFTACCTPSLRVRLGVPAANCGGWGWVARVYPALSARRGLPTRPTRPDCGCCREVDIGVYDTCTLGCRYSYGSACEAVARRRAAMHDPAGTCLLPEAVVEEKPPPRGGGFPAQGASNITGRRW